MNTSSRAHIQPIMNQFLKFVYNIFFDFSVERFWRLERNHDNAHLCMYSVCVWPGHRNMQTMNQFVLRILELLLKPGAIVYSSTDLTIDHIVLHFLGIKEF